tara:strand:- start:31390 stop:34386 length:2997 start_codon:yes stop_codon:yes gene_type:complete
MTWKLKIAAFDVHLPHYPKRMKRFFTLLISLVGLYSVQAQSTYCKPFIADTSVCDLNWIDAVTIANIDNQNFKCDKDDLGFPLDDGYSDYSDMIIYLDPVTPSLLTVQVNGFLFDAGSIWIDWNGDGEFGDEELIPLVGEAFETGMFVAIITTPANAVLDTVLKGGFRVNVDFVEPQLDPCGQNYSGEIEDYSFIVSSTPPATTPSTYCDASGPGDCSAADALIVEVELGTFINSSAACPNGSGPTYEDYTNLIAEYTIGTDATALITIDGLGTETVDLYVDWNKDGDFDDVGETFNGINVNGDGSVEIIGAIVPAGTTQGLTRMRIRVYDPVFEPGPLGACGASSYGEVEDYTLKIIDPDAPQCATLLSPVDGAIDVCIENSLVWSTAENAQFYEVLLTYANGDTAQIINVNDTTYYVGDILLPDSTYTWSITAKDTLGGVSLDCSSFTFTTTPFATASFNFASDTVSFCEGLGTTIMPNVTNGNGTIFYNWSGDNSFLDDVASATPFFTDTIEGVFKLYVEVLDSLSCYASDSVMVEVYDAPELTSFSFTSLNICPGDSVGVQVQTSNPIQFFDLKSGVYTELMPSSISSSVIYFNAADTAYVFNAVVNTAMCQDTVLMDTVYFHADVAQPTIIAELPAVGPCEGDSVLLISSYASNIVWVDGSTNDSLYVNTVRQEAVEYTFGNGFCVSTSDTIEVAFDAFPFVPFLSADKTTFCEGDSAIVSHNYVGDFEWSNGDVVNTSFAVYQTDSFSVKAISPLGCETHSEIIYFTANLNPEKPVFVVAGLVNQLCEGEPVTITTDNDNALAWSTGESTSSIVVDVDSDIWLKVTNSEGCFAVSDTVELTFGEQPERPSVIKIEGTTMDSLQCSIAGASYNWYYESLPMTYKTRTIPLEQPGLYRVNLITANGCVSELSLGFSNVGIVEAANAGIKVRNGATEWVVVSDDQIQKAVLFDITGRKLQEFENVSTLNINKNISNTLLILRMQLNGETVSIKLN